MFRCTRLLSPLLLLGLCVLGLVGRPRPPGGSHQERDEAQRSSSRKSPSSDNTAQARQAGQAPPRRGLREHQSAAGRTQGPGLRMRRSPSALCSTSWPGRPRAIVHLRKLAKCRRAGSRHDPVDPTSPLVTRPSRPAGRSRRSPSRRRLPVPCPGRLQCGRITATLPAPAAAHDPTERPSHHLPTPDPRPLLDPVPALPAGDDHVPGPGHVRQRQGGHDGGRRPAGRPTSSASWSRSSSPTRCSRSRPAGSATGSARGTP